MTDCILKKVIFKSVIIGLSILFISSDTVNGQGIVNTEKMLSDADKALTISVDISGNFSFGNIRLFQSGSSISTGLKRGDHLYRAVFGYDYLLSDGNVKSSDLFHQFRYNRFFGAHSVYGFYQIQNTKSLELENRWLTGAGVRVSLYRKNENYLDIALGGFYESERYNISTNNGELSVDNVKGNLNSFWNLKVSENIQFLSTLYYQLTLDALNDQRLFLESKLSFELKQADFTITYRNRSHTEPYISGIDKLDQRLLFGISFDL